MQKKKLRNKVVKNKPIQLIETAVRYLRIIMLRGTAVCCWSDRLDISLDCFLP